MSNSARTILVRADANREMGIGHAMRCLAVAEQCIAQGYHVVFAMHQVPDPLLARLEKASIDVRRLTNVEANLANFHTLLQETNAGFVLIDGYHISNEYEKSLRTSAVRSLRFDDYMPGDVCYADVVVNASPHAQQTAYAKWAPHAALMLGPKHISFRSDMIAAHGRMITRQKTAGTASDTNGNTSILVNFGGSDHLDMTIETVSAIAAHLPDAKIEAVTGAAYPNPERLSDLGLETLIHHHNTDNLAEIMQRARMAISAGGLTVAELALFRIPTILAITAQNQVKGAHVSWCHTIIPEENSRIDRAHLLEKILEEAKRLWQHPEERALITSRIPDELDILGTKRIVKALIGDA